MIEAIIETIKRKIKKILVALGIIGVALAAGGLPSQDNLPPCIKVDNKNICFSYTDNNSGENLLIYTDRQDYVNGDYVYFAINNKSIAQTAHIAGFFAKDSQYISDIEVLIKDVPYQVNVPEYTTITYDCSYISTTTGETIKKTCEKREITGYHQEIRYKDKWIPLKMAKYDLQAINNLVSENKIAVKSKNGYKAKKELQHYLPKGFTYFRAKIHAPMMMKEKTEFFIEAIGEKGYGHIDPFLSGYTTRRKLTIDHTKIDSDLTDFPVLVKLTSSNFDFSKSNSDGYDIRFTSSDGTTLLKYERERHDSANQVAEYWVKIPSVSSSADTEFYIYYRTDDTADGADPTNVWDSNFKMVYHLKDLTTSSVEDSTANGYDATKKATNEPVEADGKIAKGQDFDGSNDYIHIGNNTLSNTDVSSGTVEAWVNPESLVNGNDHIVFDDEGTLRLDVNRNDDGKCRFTTWDGSNQVDTFCTSIIQTGTWTYLAGTWDGSTQRIYFNGSQEDYDSANSPSPDSLDRAVRIGTSYAPDNYFNGIIDELRISTINRSAAWIKATYHTGNDTLLTYGSEETSGARRIIITE